ncbi:murein transglycosylase domain-containing protein [Marinomonas mediterranea]|uniref:murein transglycosylase domain-containing protein n=1 Tax=Marinomonas mediterranea TaxID=119864 RepID=UPI0023491FB7|nr:murein transglycosylase domain-containing protein [Marinomonas mediterranea]WCN09804.1 DUF3393 domain-containing protein [Marinomonas mediterranea]WCN13886.1 DUF3393 domain-containing protein [Marinomonas mediterranea]
MYKTWVRLTAWSFCSVLVFSLSGCHSMLNFDSVDSVDALAKQAQAVDSLEDGEALIKQAKITRNHIRADIKAIRALYKKLDQEVNKKWGKDNSELPDKKKYVKYVNDYQARAIVDFDNGHVRVETVDSRNPRDTLIKAVTTTLLTTADPTKTDIFSSSTPDTDGVPFLYPQVMDNDGVLVKYRWRAGRYAQYLVANKLERSTNSGKQVYSVEFDLVEQHEHLRQEKYSQYVLAAAQRYQLEPALIYGIIETESSFNPYAVSPANAYGLMQVVPATAGQDVYNLVKKKSGEPSKEVLFSPEQNIDIGSAYLYILQTRYLAKVNNKTSQEYSMISAYNGGTGNVLKTFDSNRTTAMNKINQASASQVYQKLRYKHPRAESRNYLEKVTKAKKNYE